MAFAALSAHADDPTSACTDASCGSDWVYFGSRVTGPGQGVFAARFDAKSGRLSPIGLVADIPRATWLLAHPQLPVLFAVSEMSGDTDGSSVFSLGVDKTTGKLSVLNSSRSGGGGATHLTLDAESKSLFVAHYGTGHVSWLPVADDGRLSLPSSVQRNYGTGPHPQRQTSPHAHGVAVDPTRRFVLAADLGADRVFAYRFNIDTRQLTPAPTPFTSATPGSGPRHLTFHPNGRLLFLLTEMAAEVVSYRWDPKRARLQHLQTLPMDEPGFVGQKSAAHIEVSRDGRFVYVSNRAANSIIAYAVNSSTGLLSEVQRISSQGKTPWDFSIDRSGHWMLVANYGSDSVAVLAVDPATGKLTETQSSLTMTQPCNVTFLPTGA